MANDPSSDKDSTTELPAPEVLKPQADVASQEIDSTSTVSPAALAKASKRQRRGTYRPSHKATFIGLAVVVAILAVNAGIIAFVIKGQSKTATQASQGQVTLSTATLNQLGVNRSTINDAGIQLVVNPDALFNGKVTINGDASFAGQLKLNSKLSAADASLTQLEAGNTSLSQLSVNGDATVTNLNLRKDLIVAGVTTLNGGSTINQLLTVNNNANISGNVAIGGTLSVSTVHTSSFVIDSTLTIGGHILTQGSKPLIQAGPSIGSYGTVSISGNDAAGTVAVNPGVGASGGIVAYITFRNYYSNIPHVIVSSIGQDVGSIYVNRTTTGFSIHVSGPLTAGVGYAFDYIVEQ